MFFLVCYSYSNLYYFTTDHDHPRFKQLERRYWCYTNYWRSMWDLYLSFERNNIKKHCTSLWSHILQICGWLWFESQLTSFSFCLLRFAVCRFLSISVTFTCTALTAYQHIFTIHRYMLNCLLQKFSCFCWRCCNFNRLWDSCTVNWMIQCFHECGNVEGSETYTHGNVFWS